MPKSLKERIDNFEFQPEIYLYPTPRMYQPLLNFSLAEVKFTDDVNLYVHIPFCKQICSFCGYLKMVNSDKMRSDYVDALVKEIKMYEEILKEKKIKTLHFGGGTPSLLEPAELEKIMGALLQANPHLLMTAQETSLEATPESVEYGKFKYFQSLGINRASLGIQSLNNEEIKLSKRHNLSDVSIRAVETLKQVRIPNIVLDLMIGIEGQTVKSFEQSVLDVFKLNPETVELYALGLMPQTGLGRKDSSSLMPAKEIYECYEIGRSLFLEAGYAQDCHNRYVIPGRGSFFQEDYVFQGMSVIGLGAGVRSYAQNVHYRNNYDSIQSRKAIVDYIQTINSGKLAVQSGIYLDAEEKIRQYAIGNIEKMDKEDFKHRFGISFEERFGELHSEMLTLNLAIDDGYTFRLTRDGLNYRDLIARQFFSEKADKLEGAYRKCQKR